MCGAGLDINTRPVCHMSIEPFSAHTGPVRIWLRFEVGTTSNIKIQDEKKK